MRSHRGSWLGSSILAAALVLVPAAATVRAQPGYGPDPFWPYNNQYTPYVMPMGPATPEAGGAGAMNARDGLRGANQFQDYLDNLQGPGRNLSDRSNVGMPYYRSAVDPLYASRSGGLRQYQVNTRSNRTFEDSQRNVSDIYFRYYSERDPARRAQYLREYRAARRDAALTVSGRERSPSRILESSTRLDPGARRIPRIGPGGNRPGAPARMRDVTDRLGIDRLGTDRLGPDRFGPAPEVPAVGTRRSSNPAPRRPLPSDVLNRSQAMEREGRNLASPGSSGPSSRLPRRPTDRPATAPTPPATDNDNP